MKDWVRRLFYRASLGDHSYLFLFEPGPSDEFIALDCETTGLNPRVDDIITIAAVKIRGNRILTSERFEAIVRPDKKPTSDSIKVHQLRAQDVESGALMFRVLPDLLRFIGGRPIIGYYIDFDMRMLDKYILRQIQTKLPNPRIEVSEMYYACKYKGAPPNTVYDLRFTSILADLGIPNLEQHDALNDTIMTAMVYLQLRDMLDRGVRLSRPRSGQEHAPMG
jgi:DNA polymerase III subunit epsilon